MPSLLSAGTISTTWLAAKSLREAGWITFSASARFIASWSAEANTSAGAPRTICCISTSEAPKFRTTLVSGCPFSYCSASVLNALVRLAAADTTRSAANAEGAPKVRAAAKTVRRRKGVIRGGQVAWTAQAQYKLLYSATSIRRSYSQLHPDRIVQSGYMCRKKHISMQPVAVTALTPWLTKIPSAAANNKKQREKGIRDHVTPHLPSAVRYPRGAPGRHGGLGGRVRRR
ncbi:hypothetical protein D3C87_1321330 [compost metagenome]